MCKLWKYDTDVGTLFKYRKPFRTTDQEMMEEYIGM